MIHDKLPSADHLPLYSCTDIPLVPPNSSSRSGKSAKKTFYSAKASYVIYATMLVHTFHYFKNIHINCAIEI